MFNKLLSNLPFNPSLIHQVSFYAKRLKKEAAIRRVGFGFIALTMVLQILAVNTPAEASCDPANNDIIRCGFSTRDQAVRHCRGNTQGFGSMLSHYGVSCDALAGAGTQTIRSTDNNRQLFSAGRRPYGKPYEYAASIQGAGNIFWRPLWSWDSAGPSSYRALTMRAANGAPMMILYDCGNLVIDQSNKPETKPEPPPVLRVGKQNNPTGSVKPGDTIEYTLGFTNTGGTAAFFSVNDELPSQMTYVSSQANGWGFEQKGQKLKWYNNTPPYYTFGNTTAFGTPGFIKVKAKVNANTPHGTTLCNKTYIEDVNPANSQVRRWNQAVVCNTVQVPCPTGQVLVNGRCTTPAVPEAACESLTIVSSASSRTKRTLKAKASTFQGATISSYTYSFGDGTKDQTVKSTDKENTVEHEYPGEGTFTTKVTVATSVGNRTSTACETVAVIKPEDKTPIPVLSKKAKNVTQGLEDATTKAANGGDVIEYSLTTTNQGDGDLKDAVLLPEDLADVLQYALLDTTSLQGGTFDQQTNALSWNDKVTIKAGQSVTRTFRVTIKNPIPETTSPDSNPGSYDMVLTNVYGNTLNIKLPKSVAKVTEQTTKSLPNTGPGTNLVIGFALTTVVGYFFARTRLLAQELEIVKDDYAHSTGGA